MKKSSLNHFLAAMFCLFLLDQATKIWITQIIPIEHFISLSQEFGIHRTYNTSYFLGSINALELWEGMSMLEFRILYVLVGLGFLIGILWVSTRKAMNMGCWVSETAKTGLYFIAGGMLGNAFDRAFRENGVVDFIRFNVYENEELYSFLIFNLADVFILFGFMLILAAWLLLLLSLIKGKHALKNKYISFYPFCKHNF